MVKFIAANAATSRLSNQILMLDSLPHNPLEATVSRFSIGLCAIFCDLVLPIAKIVDEKSSHAILRVSAEFT